MNLRFLSIRSPVVRKPKSFSYPAQIFFISTLISSVHLTSVQHSNFSSIPNPELKMTTNRNQQNSILVDSLIRSGVISSTEVISTMKMVDRGDYSANERVAYADHPHSIGFDATISAPHMHGYCLESLLKQLKKPKAKVLDVGSGSGYLTACFGRIIGEGGIVVGIDSIAELVEFSKNNFKKHDIDLLESKKVVLKVGDGWKGEPSMGPFDAIHVGAAASEIPAALVSQLANGGKMVIPVGTFSQKLMEIEKTEKGEIVSRNLMGVTYVPLVKQDKEKIKSQ